MEHALVLAPTPKAWLGVARDEGGRDRFDGVRHLPLLLLRGLCSFSVELFSLGNWVNALVELAPHLNGDASGLIGRQALAIGSNRVAPDATTSSWRVAVLDQEDLAAGRCDFDAEARRIRIKDDPVLLGRR
jgi:hypothetical protein